GESGTHLGCGERRRRTLQIVVAEIAQPADVAGLCRGQHIVGIGPRADGLAVVEAIVTAVVIEPFEALLERVVGYRVTLLLGAQQEVHRIARQPVLCRRVRCPQTESAIETLALDHAVNGVLDAVLHLGVGLLVLDPPERGDVAHIEQRQRAAGGLLEATIGIAIERTQEAGHVEVRNRTEAGIELAAAGYEALEGGTAERQTLAGRQPSRRALDDRQLRRANADLERAVEMEAARTVD